MRDQNGITLQLSANFTIKCTHTIYIFTYMKCYIVNWNQCGTWCGTFQSRKLAMQSRIKPATFSVSSHQSAFASRI